MTSIQREDFTDALRGAMQWVSEVFQDMDRAWTPAAEKILLRVPLSMVLRFDARFA